MEQNRWNRTEYTVSRWIAVLKNEQHSSSVMLHTQEVTGSSPVAPTIQMAGLALTWLYAINGGSHRPQPPHEHIILTLNR